MAMSRKSSVTGTPDTPSAEEFVPEQMSESEIAKALGAEIAVAPRFTREQLGAIDSFDAAMGLATAEYGSVIAAHEQALLGDGFRVADEGDKIRLIGVPLLLLDWVFKPSDFGRGEWVLIHAVSRGENGEAIKWVISDGGTGIARDLKEFTEKTGRDGGMAVKNGLRRSDYQTDGDTGVPLTKAQVREYMVAHKPIGQGATWYLDTSA